MSYFSRYIPRRTYSAVVGGLAGLKMPGFALRPIINIYKSILGIDMELFETPEQGFGSFQEFFVRRKKDEYLHIDAAKNHLISPCDGAVMQHGRIKDGEAWQIKGINYTIKNLLADDVYEKFTDGYFYNLYLSPRDYHRFHSPISGQLISVTNIPGELWPVNFWSVRNIPQLYAINERQVCIFQSDWGLIALVAVAAMGVGNIVIEHIPEQNQAVKIERGAELGRFLLGSSIVLLIESKAGFTPQANLDSLRVGQSLGSF